jgi:hypothetical protein
MSVSCGTAWHGVARRGTARHGAARRGTVPNEHISTFLFVFISNQN